MYRRKKLSLFKFVHNRIIEITYQRNKNKRRKTKEKSPTPITSAKLRRSPRLAQLNEGFKPQPTSPSMQQQLQSVSQIEGIQQVCSLATSSVKTAQHMFVGLEKFPTVNGIEENLTPFPEISIQAIQKVAVEECGLSPEEVAKELLMMEKEQTTVQGEETGGQAAAQATAAAN